MTKDSSTSKSKEIRVRIAPSPTGFLHVGTARAALFNFLFAKKHKGKFILRIEDTDTERSSSSFEEDIIHGLKWLGLEWDEGPQQGEKVKYKGDFGPYRQSERSNIYKKYIEKLIKEDKAYYCFCSKEELEKHKQYMMSIGEAPRYSGTCRDLSAEEIEQKLTEGKPYIVRLKTPSKKVSFKDFIRGKVEFDASLFGDFSIAKNENTPLYNLAVVIDDYEMKISHVIRGEDHISNTPKQILVQEALDLQPVEYAHLPLILGPDKSKLSKRHGAVSVTDYKKKGYLPEAIVNVIALLGWNPGTEREIYSLPSLVKDFSLEKCQKGGAVFNLERLDWINGFYIRKSSISRITNLAVPFLIDSNLIEEIKNNYGNLNIPNGSKGPKELKLFKENERKFKIIDTKEAISIKWIQRVIAIHKERLKKVSEIVEIADFFFKEEIDYSKDLLIWKKASDEETKQSLEKLERILSNLDVSSFTEQQLKDILMVEAEKLGNRGTLLWPLRVSLSGKKASAGPFEIAEILGKKKVLKRIEKAKQLFN